MRNKAREQQLVEQLEKELQMQAQKTRLFAKQGRYGAGFPLWLFIWLLLNPVPGFYIRICYEEQGIVHRTDCKNAKSLLGLKNAK